MRVLELFSGTGNLSRIAREMGHDAVTVDLYEAADMQVDLLSVDPEHFLLHQASDLLGGWPDMVWASPPCQGFSVASIGKMWRQGPSGFEPIHPTSAMGLRLLNRTVEMLSVAQRIEALWFMENPRGMMRRFMTDPPKTVTYCQYGETRMKPTDIWTNNPAWVPRPHCKNGDPCHESAPRGSRTGTQGIKDAKSRGRLPDELCREVIESVERRLAK